MKRNVALVLASKSKSKYSRCITRFLRSYRSFAKDGALLSLYRIEKPKVAYGIEVRNLSEYSFPDEVWDDLNTILKQSMMN